MGKGISNRGTENRYTFNADDYQSTVQAEKEKVHLEIDITGHASPRWKGAKTMQEAAQNNMDLSKKRTAAARFWIEQYFLDALKDFDITFSYNEDFSYDVEYAPATHSIHQTSYGNEITLREADGNKEANEEYLRRVDIQVSFSNFVQLKSTRRRGERVTQYAASKRWGLKIGTVTDADLDQGLGRVAGVKFLFFKLRNLRPEMVKKNRENWGVMVIINIGGKLSLTDLVAFGSVRRLMKIHSNLKKIKRAKTVLKQVLKLKKLNDIVELFNVKLSFGKEIILKTKKLHTIDEFQECIITGPGASISVLQVEAAVERLTLVGLGSDGSNQENVPLDLSGYSVSGLPVLDATGEIGARLGKMFMLAQTTDDFKKDIIRSRSESSQFRSFSEQKHSIFFDTKSSTITDKEKMYLKSFVSHLSEEYKLYSNTY